MEESSLRLIHVIFRHGQRGPDKILSYKGDPYANETYMPFGPNQLTLIGRKQSYNLGKTLRKRYGNFIGPEYYNGLINAKSTGRSRTRMSLELVLAALFPPTPATQIHKHLNWQPIPITSEPMKDDPLLGTIINILTKNENAPEFRKTVSSNKVVNCIEKHLNWNVEKHITSALMYDTVKVQVECGLAVPIWCADIFPDDMREEFETFMQHNFNKKDFQAYISGGLLQEIIKTMIQKVKDVQRGENETSSKLYLYAGHDLNLVSLLGILKRFELTNWPNYNANLAFELHEIKDEFYVKIAYQNGPIDSQNFDQMRELDYFSLPYSQDTLIRLNDFTAYIEKHVLNITQE